MRVFLGPAADLWPGELRGVCVQGKKIVLANVDGQVRAYEDRCPHKGVELSRGRLRKTVLTCWAHEWQFDLATGAGVNPAAASLSPLPAEVCDGEIVVDV